MELVAVGTYECPDITLAKALEYLNRGYKVLSEGYDTFNRFAYALEMKPGEIGYRRIVESLRRYGLIEDREALKLADLAKKALFGFTQKDKDEARVAAWLNIELIKDVYERTNGIMPEDRGECFSLIGRITGADPAEVHEKSELLLKLCNEAFQDIRAKEKVLEEVERPAIPEKIEAKVEVPPAPEAVVTSAGIIEARLGEVYVRMPKSVAGLEVAKKLIELLEAQVKA